MAGVGLSVTVDLPDMVVLSAIQDDSDEEDNVVDRETALRDQITKMNRKTVREATTSEDKCRQFITIVMCTFCEPRLVCVMRSLMTFPEREKVQATVLAKRLQLDVKQLRKYLADLKANGYIQETSQKTGYSKFGREAKSACYYIDYMYFIQMVKLRLHKILTRLNEKSESESGTGDGYVCSKRDCDEYLRTYDTLDLILNKKTVAPSMDDSSDINSSGAFGGGSFMCDSCGTPLELASDVFDTSDTSLNVKKKFNDQVKKIRTLMQQLFKLINEERMQMKYEADKATEELEHLMNSYDDAGYKASTINTLKNKFKQKEGGPAHLQHIGRRKKMSAKEFKDFEINPETVAGDPNNNGDNSASVNAENGGDGTSSSAAKSTAQTDAKVVKERKKIEKAKNEMLQTDQHLRMEKLRLENNSQNRRDSPDVDIDNLTVTVNTKSYPLAKVMSNDDLIDAMTSEEFQKYDQLLVELGLIFID